MKKSISITTESGVVKKGSIASDSSKPLACLKRKGILLWVLGGVLLLIAVGLGVGLGIGLTRKSSKQEVSQTASPEADEGGASSSSITATTRSRARSRTVAHSTAHTTQTPSISSTNTFKVRPSQTSANWWQPTAGTTWDIALIQPPNNTDAKLQAFDVDLFDNDLAFMANLKLKGHRVICYFSAGSYEDWRPDAKNFTKSDYGEAMDGWAGEWWLDTNSDNVRNIMVSRIELAQEKGCDAIDPDNINGYQNPTGFNLTQDDAISFLKFMADESHKRGMAIGLKNGGEVVEMVIDYMDFCIQESCVAWDECQPYQMFLEYDSPVFHIEYPDVSNLTVSEICDPDNGAKGFSTIIKHLNLDDWIKVCP